MNLPNLLEKLMPKSISEEQEKRIKETEEVVATSRKTRRQADTEILRSYRAAGQRIHRHEWSK